MHAQDLVKYSRVFMHTPNVFMGKETDGRLHDITGRLVRQSRGAAYGIGLKGISCANHLIGRMLSAA